MQLTLKIKDIPEDFAGGGLHLDVPFTRELLASALAGPPSAPSLLSADVDGSRAEAHLDIARTGDTVSIRGLLEGDIKAPCTRCLNEAHLAIRIPLRVIIGPESNGAEESVEDEIEYFSHDGDKLDLSPILRETLLLALPMTILCRDNCRGLCAVCGTDRNERECGCKAPELVDPRLAVLKDIKL